MVGFGIEIVRGLVVCGQRCRTCFWPEGSTTLTVSG